MDFIRITLCYFVIRLQHILLQVMSAYVLIIDNTV